ncbi:MAG TPA: M20/M25/M40 family metallo-hydrolase, partial [Limnochordia bacterium]|nr:M20/M25/M40 family metallo-hydrolase [Limnochordia bacterium]
PPMTPAVVTIGSIHGGSAHNVIADQVVLNGTIRTMDENTRTLVWKAVERTATGAAAAHECRAEVAIQRGYPVLVNDAEQTEFARRRASQILPEARVRPMEPGMGGEDFSFYLQHIPGSFGRLGGAPPGESELFNLHTARLKVDENAFVVGVAYWLALALGE